ncbi:MAG: RagB/SusD family nutrient uptake outer membrane protein [Saprospiraceae bacterium]
MLAFKEKIMTRKYIAILFIFLLSACTDILDQEPLGILDAGAFLNTVSDARQAVNAAYEPLLINNNNNNFYWAFGVVASDNAIAGGDGSRRGIEEIDFFEQTPRTEELNDFWKLQYAGIVQANTVIEQVPNIEGDETLKNNIIGEALFLRAWYHFLLAQVFGDIPLAIEILPPDEVRIPRTPRAQVYEQIVLDCERAADLLPASYPASEIGRVASGAALALKAKTHIYQENWQEALNTVAEIKNLGIYGLMENYQDNFTEGLQNNQESVWEIQHANLELGVGNNINQWWTSQKIEDGYGFAEASPEFAEAFEPGDPREGFTIAQNNDEYLGRIYKRSFSSTGFGPVKFLQSIEEVSQISDGSINYPAIRFAEVLLWEAEALAELGRTNEALIPLEAVRARARNQSEDPNTVLPEITTTNQEELIDLIRHERRVELGYEFHRFFDLVRWGIAGQLMEDFQVGKHEYFPLPQAELDLNNLLTQNPGY